MRTILSRLNNNPIGFFDSGVGGVTVYEQVKKLLPNENYIYFGDTKNMPYGEKPEEQLLEFADKIFRFLEQQNTKAVVMACNTTSAITYEKLKNNYNFKIYPIIQSVCSTLAGLDGVKKLGVIATPATINSHSYSAEIAKYNPKMQIFELAAPNWVRIVEEHRITQPQSIIQIKEILDIGTGSGCIACTIAKQTEAVVLGVDISSDALRIALDNVTKLGINNRAVFRKSNLFEKVREDERFDMIISNPPYIPIGTPVEPEVLHEPAEALFSAENGLQFYRRIIEDAPEYLKPRGYLMFELGVGESESVALMMEKSFQGIHIMQDLAGIDRVIYGYLK